MFTNESVYRSHRIVDEFRKMAVAGLTPPEKYCVDLVPQSKRHSILDVGVGAGRTTGPLLDLFEKYIGIDRSREMVAAAKLIYPAADLRIMDACKLELAERFDCVLFSFNGIDYVDYEKRQSILCQIAAVLRPEGFLIYSTHNLHNRRVRGWLRLPLSRDLVRPLRSLLKMRRLRTIGYRLFNFWRQSGSQNERFAYVNDEGEGYTLLTTYVDVKEEIKTLQQYGFAVMVTIGNTKQVSAYDADDSWVYILARLTQLSSTSVP